MCGFSGFFSQTSFPSNSIDVLKNMGNAIASRGPDSSGEWFDAEHKLGFSHRRLAIVDLSPAGHQPMQSHSKRFVIAFNGEIYNHMELRQELESLDGNIMWHGQSDTETLLKGFEAWGIKETVEKATGMFAFSVWDHQKNCLVLGRDRLGEKPLYYGWQGDTFLFGSQLKALKEHPDFNVEVDRDSLTLLVRHTYIPAPYSIYKGINKLLPGHLLYLDTETKQYRTECYWSLKNILTKYESKSIDVAPEQAIDQLENELKRVLKGQMLADVPLGAFLSGGIDSSLVVALMQSQSEEPIKTFTMGFHDKKFNEAEHAKAISEHLGTEHTELYVAPKDVLNVVDKLSSLYDEPFADPSQIPTFLVSQLASQHVDVVLSGDGGDELFCGYQRYVLIKKMWAKLRYIPLPLRRIATVFLQKISSKIWSRLLYRVGLFLGSPNLGDKLHKLCRILDATDIDDLYLSYISLDKAPADIVIDGVEPKSLFTDPDRKPAVKNDLKRMMAIDALSYLPDDILTKIDRATMGVSVEGRVPMLDHQFVETAFAQAQNIKIRNGSQKWCLKEVLFRYVPKKLIERPKMGFAIPIDHWLRHELKAFADRLIAREKLDEQGYFDTDMVRKLWSQHQSGYHNWGWQLWSILMFQLWLEKEILA